MGRLFSVETWFAVGARRELRGWMRWLGIPLTLAIAVYVIYAALLAIIDPWLLGAIFLSAMLCLVFLTVGPAPNSDPHKPNPVDWVLSGAAVAVGIYLFMHSDAIVKRMALFDDLSDVQILVGSVVLLLTVEATRRTTGLGLTLIVVMIIAYNLFGHLFEGVLTHSPITYGQFLDISVYTTDGVFGLPVRVAATYAFLFVMFGTFLQYSGGGEFFFRCAAAFTGRSHGGPAKVAVVSSGLFGTISGSPVSDVVTTGSVTIPMMKRLHYSPAFAGGVEVAASTGGSILPPVMGSAAFIMAEFTGISYAEIALAAVLPAILYYVCVFMQVHFRARKLNLLPLDSEQIPPRRQAFRGGGIFIVPLIALCTALGMGYSAGTTALVGTVAVIAVALFYKGQRIGPVQLLKGLSETTLRVVPVAGATAAAGLVVAGITMTGLAAKFALLVSFVAGDSHFLTLVMAALLTTVLGMGMPTPSAYILAAALVGPLLTQMGIPVIAAHMFLLYYAVLSALTPPVAVAAYAAAPLAEENPLKIAGVATKLALAAFVVPFVFVYSPTLLLIGPSWKIVLDFVTAAIGLVSLAAAIEGYAWRQVALWERPLLVAAGVCLLIPSLFWAGVGLALLALHALISWLRPAMGLAAEP